jgi:uncharacterized integral membrane protein
VAGDLEPTKERAPAQQRERARMAAAVVLVGLGAAFALVNLKDVKVNWIVGSARSPLILVIAVCLAVGALIDRIAVSRRRKKPPAS